MFFLSPFSFFTSSFLNNAVTYTLDQCRQCLKIEIYGEASKAQSINYTKPCFIMQIMSAKVLNHGKVQKIILHNAHNECKSPEWQQGIRILLHNAQNEHKSPESFSDKACLHTNYFLQPSCTLNWRRANATDYRVGNNATVGGLKEGQCNRQWSRWTEGGPVQETTVGELKPGQHNKQ